MAQLGALSAQGAEGLKGQLNKWMPEWHLITMLLRAHAREADLPGAVHAMRGQHGSAGEAWRYALCSRSIMLTARADSETCGLVMCHLCMLCAFCTSRKVIRATSSCAEYLPFRSYKRHHGSQIDAGITIALTQFGACDMQTWRQIDSRTMPSWRRMWQQQTCRVWQTCTER